jgi:hypothetical protein
MELEPQLPLYTSNDPLADFADDSPDSHDLALPAAAPPSSLDEDEVLNAPTARYEDVEIASSHVEPAVSIEETPMPGPIGLITGHDPEAESAFERSRSAVWPLVLALSVGLAIGFAGGYGVGSHDRTPPGGVATTGAAPGGREFTESAVTEPAKPVAPVAAAPAPPVAAATPAPQADVARGRLLVRTMPAGAQVSIDGKDAGRTPATVRDLARGPHHVRVTRDGYAAQERRVVISASRPSQSVNIALARAPLPPPARTAPAAPAASAAAPAAAARLPGALEVESRPPGAKVYLDGTLIGNTPLSLPAVPPGEHAVRLEYDGYRLWASSIRIVASEKNRVRASLER